MKDGEPWWPYPIPQPSAEALKALADTFPVVVVEPPKYHGPVVLDFHAIRERQKELFP